MELLEEILNPENLNKAYKKSISKQRSIRGWWRNCRRNSGIYKRQQESHNKPNKEKKI